MSNKGGVDLFSNNRPTFVPQPDFSSVMLGIENIFVDSCDKEVKAVGMVYRKASET